MSVLDRLQDRRSVSLCFASCVSCPYNIVDMSMIGTLAAASINPSSGWTGCSSTSDWLSCASSLSPGILSLIDWEMNDSIACRRKQCAVRSATKPQEYNKQEWKVVVTNKCKVHNYAVTAPSDQCGAAIFVPPVFAPVQGPSTVCFCHLPLSSCEFEQSFLLSEPCQATKDYFLAKRLASLSSGIISAVAAAQRIISAGLHCLPQGNGQPAPAAERRAHKLAKFQQWNRLAILTMSS